MHAEKSVGLIELENRMAEMSLVSKLDVNDIRIEALLFQIGYLTITEEVKDGYRTFYRWIIPI